MKVAVGIIVAIVFFALGWFAHEYRADIPFLQYLQPAAIDEDTQEPEENTDDNMTLCAQVITPAVNPETGDIQEFPTPCDVPEGWEPIQNDIPGMELEVI